MCSSDLTVSNSACVQGITEDDIAAYLANTPGFFERQAEMLASVQLTSPHGARAVSLQERQMEMLRDRIARPTQSCRNVKLKRMADYLPRLGSAQMFQSLGRRPKDIVEANPRKHVQLGLTRGVEYPTSAVLEGCLGPLERKLLDVQSGHRPQLPGLAIVRVEMVHLALGFQGLLVAVGLARRDPFVRNLEVEIQPDDEHLGNAHVVGELEHRQYDRLAPIHAYEREIGRAHV